MPIFSIIVPVYKVERCIEKCINSILNQTFRDFELILVDDGSPDKSGMICDEYRKRDSRVVVIHKENGGVSSARNKGLEVAKGTYIAFVDSDDWVENDYLERLYNPSVDITLCNINYVNLNSNNSYKLNSRKIGVFNTEKEIIEELIESRYISTAFCKAYRKEIIEKNNIKFNSNFSLGEDTMFVVDYIINSKNLQISNYAVYNYIDYGIESLSKFSYNKLKQLEKANQYIEKKLSKVYLGSESQAFKKRLWSMYRWGIFEVVNTNNINLLEKIKILKYIFKNKDYAKLISEINIYMDKDSKIVRRILSSKNAVLVLLFFKLHEFKNAINQRT